jgi:hypothetical protein
MDMTRKRVVTERDPGPPRWHSRTVTGVSLEPAFFGEQRGWKGVVAGEPWCFVQKATKRWGGFTRDHLTGTPVLLSLEKLVAWVIEHQAEWQAKLKVRRKAGTRMVDPRVDNATLPRLIK